MVDVVIAGGGIAGSALAIQLGRRGLRVELFDRAVFPREKPCGEGLMPAGVAVLERMGLARRTGGAPFEGVRYRFERHTAEGRFLQGQVGLGQRRRRLDHVLLEEAAATPGVAVHTGAVVEGPHCCNGRVAGLNVGGDVRRGRLVVAADGARSRVRHALGLDVPPRRKRVGLRAHFRLAPGRQNTRWVDVFVMRGAEIYVTPLPHRELLVAVLTAAESVEPPLEQSFERWVRAQPELAARLAGAERITPVAAAGPLEGGARRGVAPGLVLLGDAAGFSDPVTGGGMTQALLAAELLARYVAERGVESTWLDAFDRERRRMLRDYRTLTRLVLWLNERPRLCGPLFAALGRRPRLFSYLVAVAGGTRGFFNPGRPPNSRRMHAMENPPMSRMEEDSHDSWISYRSRGLPDEHRAAPVPD
jgi:flavin-dependent dehydrogenase